MNLQPATTGASQRAMLYLMDPKVFRYLVFAQDGAFVAQCLDVDVASEGDTEDEAVANLTEALQLRFEGEAQPVIATRAVRFGEISLDA